MKTKNKIDTSNVANAALQFLIDHAAKTRGAEIALAERMTKRTGQQVLRQQVQGWLNPDPEKRIEPKLGVGLMLILEGRAMIQGSAEGEARVLDLSEVLRKGRKAKQ